VKKGLFVARQISYRHTFTNSICTFFSRITGVLKQNVISYLFGVAADRFVASFRLVNAFRRYIGEGGALGNAFIPVFQEKMVKDGKEKAFLFASNILNFFLLVTTGLTILLVVLIPAYFPFIVMGFKKGSIEYLETLYLYLIMLPYITLICLFAIYMGILNSFKKFLASAVAPVVSNIIFIVFPILTHKRTGIYSLGLSVTIGVLAMILCQIFELKQIGFKYSFYLNLKDPELKKFFSLFFPTAGNMLFLTLKNLLTTSFLTFFAGGNIVMLNALMIVEAPLGIISIAIGTVLMPVLSKLNSENQIENFKKAIDEAINLLCYFMIPISIFIIFFPDTVVNSVFRDIMMFFTGNTGKYTQQLLDKTYLATSIYSTGLFAMGATVIFEKIFYSLHDAKTPLKANVIVFLWSFIFYFSAFIPQVGIYGIFIADTIGAWLTYIYYRVIMNKKEKLQTKFSGKILILCGISLLSVAITYPFYHFIYLRKYYSLISMSIAAIQLFLFSIIYYILTKWLKMELKR